MGEVGWEGGVGDKELGEGLPGFSVPEWEWVMFIDEN